MGMLDEWAGCSSGSRCTSSFSARELAASGRLSCCVLLTALLIALFYPVAARAGSAVPILNLGLDEAVPLQYKKSVDSVFISNPDIADYQVVKGNQLIVFGKKVGNATLIVMDARGKVVDNQTLVVNKSLAHIRQQLQIRYPDQDIDITNLGDQVVLTGTVNSEQLRQGIYTLVGELLGKDYEDVRLSWGAGEQSMEIDFMTKRRYKGLVNNIKVEETKQLNVKVTIAEVSSSFLQEIGVKWGGVTGSGEDTTFMGNGQIATFPLRGITSYDIARYISAVDDDGMGRVLAEPNLSVISGEKASFLAGGEMPIVTYQEDKYHVEYKEFGIRLEVAAKVLSDSKIKLSMMPEVSAIDQTYRDNVFSIPTFKTRRALTTLELGDGESFVLGGLLNTEDREALSKIPLVGDLPVIGAMFRHTRNERRKSELIIVATVNLVKPVPPNSIQIPDLKRVNTLRRFFRLDLPVERKTGSASYQNVQKILAQGGFKL